MELLVQRIDQRRCATLVTRSDGVRYVVNGVGVKFVIPHDLAHLAIEGALLLQPRAFAASDIHAAWTSWHEMRDLWDALPLGGQLQFRWFESSANGRRGSQHGGNRPSLVMYVAG